MTCGRCGSDALAVIELITRDVAIVATDSGFVRDPRTVILNDEDMASAIGFRCWSCGFQSPDLRGLTAKPEQAEALAAA